MEMSSVDEYALLDLEIWAFDTQLRVVAYTWWFKPWTRVRSPRKREKNVHNLASRNTDLKCSGEEEEPAQETEKVQVGSKKEA